MHYSGTAPDDLGIIFDNPIFVAGGTAWVLCLDGRSKLPQTVADIRNACQSLRQFLDDAQEHDPEEALAAITAGPSSQTSYRAKVKYRLTQVCQALESLWRAMRFLPGAIAPPDMPQDVASIDQALQATDHIAQWCDENQRTADDAENPPKTQADDPQPPVDAARIPPPPSSLTKLPDWIRSARELLRDQEDQPIRETGIASLVRGHFLRHMEKLCPDWTEWYRQCRPNEFRVVRELVVMMTEVGRRIGGEDVAGSKRVGFGSDRQTARKIKGKTKLAIAMMLVQEHPDWSDRYIAEQAGYKSHSTLVRNKTYQTAAAMARGQKEDLPHGAKDGETRNVEAWEDADEQDENEED